MSNLNMIDDFEWFPDEIPNIPCEYDIARWIKPQKEV